MAINQVTATEIHPLGRATMHPDTGIEAGSWGTWTLRYQVPPGGIDDGGAVRVALRIVSDWARPQLTDPAKDHYLTVSCSRPGTMLDAEWRILGNVRPHQKHLNIQVFDEPLQAGDEITVVFGDRSGGSRGTRAQTYVEDHCEFPISVDRFTTGIFELVPDFPCVQIVAAEPCRLVAAARGDGSATHPVRLLVRAEDRWGNPVRKTIEGPVALQASGVSVELPSQVELQGGRCEIGPFSCRGSGVLRIRAEHATLGSCESGPLRVHGDNSHDFDKPTRRFFWGDMHGQSRETVGANTAEQYFQYARDTAFSDFSGHQANCFQVTDAFWAELNRLSKEFTRDDEFIVLPGYEWSGLTPVGGDHNVFYLDEDREILRCGTIQAENPVQDEDFSPATKLYAALKEREGECIVIPHVGGRRANLDFFDPELEPAVEIHSCWGTFEWFYHDALRRGYRVGVVANSDGHKGRPAAEHAGAGYFGVYGGLTCILAETLNRKALFSALKQRRCYATSGARIVVAAKLSGQTIGSTLKLSKDPLVLELQAHGTAPIEQIDLLAAGMPLATWEGSPYQERSGTQVRIRWSGARNFNRRRTVVWNGSLSIDGNKLTSVDGYAFDSPAEGIEDWSDRSVTWSSITSGDEDGLVLTLAEELTGTLSFQTGPLTHRFDLKELSAAPLVFELGGVEQQVVFEKAPQPDALAQDVAWKLDVSPRVSDAINGQVPLHLRIQQLDGHRAWTSAWFVKV